MSEQKFTGTVKWFDETKGFGFIEYGADKDIFVHFSAIKSNGFRVLQEGQKVEFTAQETDRGLQAADVEVM